MSEWNGFPQEWSEQEIRAFVRDELYDLDERIRRIVREELAAARTPAGRDPEDWLRDEEQ